MKTAGTTGELDMDLRKVCLSPCCCQTTLHDSFDSLTMEAGRAQQPCFRKPCRGRVDNLSVNNQVPLSLVGPQCASLLDIFASRSRRFS